ncbi:MAG: right-handed parallel beta-helix repeat-containing protein [Verrucomicrobia bacterium]|nr:right-handed parallel beta-helix repeat-containing protein [Verrucomicrobiota bacterium]MBU1734806.1 right-handed parallel beta-helix repeat-containing protein [Verrucomicrobiota bacterium]MBU1858023.1 right-handed parallel beta-helix repeat-containing protein [Verrucomicrobiota bacterium]
MKNIKKIFAVKIGIGLALLLMGLNTGLAQTTNYVVEPGKETGAPVSPYTSWDTAATSIYNAVAVANTGNVNVVVISNGYYVLTNRIEVTNAFRIRSWNNGGIDRENTIVDGNKSVPCFLVSNSAAVIEGLTITNGFGSGGVGVYMNAGTITNCIISGNLASNAAQNAYGAGIYTAAGGNCVIANSTICANRVTNSTYGGGGIYINSSSTKVNNCIISNNYTHNRSGAGMYISYPTVISNCDIVDNTIVAGWGGGGIYLESYGGGEITGCLISRNKAGGLGGGGINHYASSSTNVLFERCVISFNSSTHFGGGLKQQSATCSNLVLRSCLIISNSATRGGGLDLISSINTRAENCTIAYNTATTADEAGGVTIGTNGVTLFNTIVYYNSASGGYPDIRIRDSGANTSVNYCCVRYSDGVWDGVTNGINNITNTPLFVNADIGNYRLSMNSPCMNAGINQSWMTGAADLDGHRRVNKFIGIVDMGCYEDVPTGTIITIP